MFAIDDPTAVAVMPTPEAAGTPGFFTEGNPALGQAATYVRSSWLNALQQELLNVLASASVPPNKTVYNQLATALRSNGLIYGIDSGVANAVVLNLASSVPALRDGMVLWFRAAATNTGPTTLNLGGLGAIPVVGGGHMPLQGGEIAINGICQVSYNAFYGVFVLIEGLGAPLQVGAASRSNHAMQLGQAVGRLINVQVLTSSGTYTRTPGATSGLVRILGGGAGSSGSGATAAGQISIGQGGGSGAWGEHFYNGNLPATQAYTIGAAGTAGGVGGAGGAGGTTTFGTLSAPGAPGTSGPVTAAPPLLIGGGAGAVTGTGCNILNMPGNYGAYGTGGGVGSFISGGGAGTPYGAGGAPNVTGGANGSASPSKGGGGAGASNGQSSGGFTGGAGGAGLIVVFEFA